MTLLSQEIVLLALPLSSFWVMTLISRILDCFIIPLVFRLIILLLVSLCIRPSMLLICFKNLLCMTASLIKLLVHLIIIFFLMIAVYCLILNPIGVWLVLCNSSVSPNKISPLFFNRPINTRVVLLKTIFKLLSEFLDIFKVLSIFFLLLLQVPLLYLPIVMQIKLEIL